MSNPKPRNAIRSHGGLLRSLYLVAAVILVVVLDSDANSAAAMSNNTDDDCKDLVSDHVVCTFANLCNCTKVLETYDCGGDITSSMGNSVPVNEVCAKTCNACDAETPPPPCEDEIATHGICLFAKQCSCTDDILANYACGSEIVSGMGNTMVNSICRKTCNACDADPADPPAAVFPGEVQGHLPFGIAGGHKRDLYYHVKEDKVDFRMTFHNSTIWSAFQYWSGTNTKAIYDGTLSNATSGYQCYIADGVAACDAFRVRHFFLKWDDLPGTENDLDDLFVKRSVTSCTQKRATFIADNGVSYCQYNAEHPEKSSIIISSSSGRGTVLIVDVLPIEDSDMYDVAVAYDESTGVYTGTWSRSRAYPFEIGGSVLTVRWAVATTFRKYEWFEGGFMYHGPTSYETWPSGKERLYLSPEAQAAGKVEMETDAHANIAFMSDDVEDRLRLFRNDPATANVTSDDTNEDTDGPGDSDDGSGAASIAGIISVMAMALGQLLLVATMP